MIQSYFNEIHPKINCKYNLITHNSDYSINKNYLKLVGVYSNPRRDPRRSTVSIAYMTLFDKGSQKLHAGDDALDPKFESKWKEFEVAFDHKEIILDAINNLK